ncbi:MAG: hypothetical protein DCC58_06880 [Chloroflexi bacterium]|nr:MAG: hypothetical protein DCC58_06880 [Chloroflexota bacterium]
MLYQRCRLDTLGFDDLTPIVGPAGTPLGYVDAARAALTLIEGRVVVPGPQPLVLQGGDGRQAHAVVADPAGAPQITPLYTVTFAGAAPSEGAAAPAMPEGARLVRRFGAERRIDVYRLNAAIQQTLAGIRATRAGRPGFVTNMEPPRMAQYTSDGCLVALVGADPDQAAGIAHTLQHALEQVLRAVVPSGILEGERHVLELPALRVDEQQVPAILLTDGVDGGLGLGALLSNSIEDMLTAAQQVLLACPCREGCAACLGNPSCSVAHWAADCRALLAKQATLQFLGAALSTPAPAGLGPTRYTPLSSEPLLAQLRDRVLHEALYPLLGAPPDDYIPPPARFMDHDELAQHDLAGLYLQNDPWRDVVVRPALEEDLVATLAHLYTHDWQFRLADDGQPHMEPTHCDPSQVPLDGRLLREGVAQWVERYALDALGYALPPGRPTFRIFNDHHEGYRIVDTLVRQQGVNGLLHFLHAPFSAENLARLASTAGVDGALSLLRRQAAAGTLVLPPDDIVSVSAAEQATTQPTSATEP